MILLLASFSLLSPIICSASGFDGLGSMWNEAINTPAPNSMAANIDLAFQQSIASPVSQNYMAQNTKTTDPEIAIKEKKKIVTLKDLETITTQPDSPEALLLLMEKLKGNAHVPRHEWHTEMQNAINDIISQALENANPNYIHNLPLEQLSTAEDLTPLEKLPTLKNNTNPSVQGIIHDTDNFVQTALKKAVTNWVINTPDEQDNNRTLLFKTIEVFNPALFSICLNFNTPLDHQDTHGYTPIHLAAILNKRILLRDLLNKLSEQKRLPIINYQDNNGWTALHAAANTNNSATVQLLLQYGADTNIKNKTGETPVDIARKHNNADIIKKLEEAASDKHRQELLKQQEELFKNLQKETHKNAKAQTPSDFDNAFQNSKQYVAENSAKTLLEQAENAEKNLQERAEAEKKARLKALLQIRTQSKSPEALFQLAIRAKSSVSLNDFQVEMQKAINGIIIPTLEQANPNYIHNLDVEKLTEQDLTPLDKLQTLENNPNPFVQEILHDKDEFTQTALKNAIRNWVINAYDMQSYSGNPLLLRAIESEKLELVRLLLHRGAYINAINKRRENALSYSAQVGDPAITQLLLDSLDGQNKSQIINHQDQWGYTPLSSAVIGNSPAVVQLLLQSGADQTIKDYKGNTPLDIAQENKYEAIVKLLETAKRVKQQTDLLNNVKNDLEIYQKQDPRFSEVQLLSEYQKQLQQPMSEARRQKLQDQITAVELLLELQKQGKL